MCDNVLRHTSTVSMPPQRWVPIVESPLCTFARDLLLYMEWSINKVSKPGSNRTATQNMIQRTSQLRGTWNIP